MVDYHSQLVTALNTVLPTYYENNLSRENCEIPCISYYERNNYTSLQGDSVGYSKLSYYVKVWGESIKDLQNYSGVIDTKLRELGWIRTSSYELYDQESAMIQKIMVYEALFKEEY